MSKTSSNSLGFSFDFLENLVANGGYVSDVQIYCETICNFHHHPARDKELQFDIWDKEQTIILQRAHIESEKVNIYMRSLHARRLNPEIVYVRETRK